MAINDSFNLNNALTSQSYAYKCWYNYNYCGNTMGIDSKSMSEINQNWSGELANWRATASNDENAYEIEDDDYSSAKNRGKEIGKDKTGYDGGKGGMIANTTVDAALGAGTAAMSFGAGKLVEKGVAKIGTNMMNKAAANIASNTSLNSAGKIVSSSSSKLGETGAKLSDAAANGVGSKGAKISDIATVVMAAATAAKYWIQKPNKEQKEACDELQNTMTDAQTSLADAQGDMETYAAEVEEKSNEAEEYNNERNDEIEKQKTEFDMYRRSYDALMEKVNNGETLTDSEKELLKQLVPVMQELGETMNDGIDETTETVADIYDEMGTYQEGYDGAAETMGEVEGLTDFAESFDKATQTSCYVQTAAQTLNATGAGLAAARLAGKAFVGWAFAAVGIAAAASSGAAALQQKEWAGNVGTEIGKREATQDFNASTSEIYDERIADYEGYLGVVDDLELEVPDDMEVPDEPPTIPTGNEEGSTTSGGFGVTTTNNGTTGTNSTTNDPNKKDKDPKDKGVA